MKYTNMVGQVFVFVFFKAFQIAYSLTISGSGNYIIPNTCYELTCSYDTFKDYRQTVYNFFNDTSNGINGIKTITIRYVNSTGQCNYRNPHYVPCTNDVCTCDQDGMATHICYNHTSNITGNITVNCFSGDNSRIRIPVAVGPGDSLGFIPPSTHVNKTLGEYFGPITCSAACYPECQYEWTMQSRPTTRESTLNITSLTKDDDGIYSCKAWNEVYTSGKSITFNVTINYGPESVSLSPLDTQYTVTEGKELISITCRADCKPACDYTWSGSNVPTGTGNVLILRNISKNQRGVFNCAASNNVGSFNSYDVNIDVQFGPGSSMKFEPSITAVIKNKGNTLGPINCAAICNPPCQYKWTKPDKTVIISAQLMLASLSIEDQGQFICTATNGIGSSVNQSLDVKVNFAPYLDNNKPYAPSYVRATENSSLLLTLTLYANPIPTTEWTFKAETDCKIISIASNTTTNEFLTSTSVSIDKVQSNDFGEYTFTANNTVGIFFRRFVVIKEASSKQETCARTEERTDIFVVGIVTLVVGLLSLSASVIFIVRNSFRTKTIKSTKSVEYTGVQKENPAFIHEYTTIQSEIEPSQPQEQRSHTYEECDRKTEANPYRNVNALGSVAKHPEEHAIGINIYEECGRNFEAHAYDTLEK